MNARELLLRRIADLGDEDVRALLAVVERLYASIQSTREPAPKAPSEALRHPERFGTMSGSVRVVGDVVAPVVEPERWTFDVENVGS